MLRSIPTLAFISAIGLAHAETAAAQEAAAIHVYGPGGPAPAMSDCASAFNSRNGANVIVTFGPTGPWRDQASRDAEPVYVRSATIMVHKGNPLKIEHFGDLLRPGVRVMVVQGRADGIVGGHCPSHRRYRDDKGPSPQHRRLRTRHGDRA